METLLTTIKSPIYKTQSFSKSSHNSNPSCTLKQAFVSLTNNLNHPQTRRLDDAYSTVLEQCITKQSLPLVKQVHTHVIKSCHVVDTTFLSTKLVFAYGKSRSLFDAQKVFDEMSERTVFTWNALIGGYMVNGEPLEAIRLFVDMNVLGVCSDASTFASVVKCCGEVEDRCIGIQVHGLVVKLGFVCNVYVGNSLIAMYAKCNDSDSAKMLFERSEKTDVVSWNSIISACSASGQASEALRLFREMHVVRVVPNSYTFVATLQACEESLYLVFGKELHAFLLKSDLYQDTRVKNALVVMYAKCGKMKEAASIFYAMDEKDSITWNSLLSGFVQNGFYDAVVDLFHEMQNAGQKPDRYSITSMISAVGRLGSLLNIREIHAYAMKRMMDSDLQVCNTLVDIYAKCGKMNYAESLFERIDCKDNISWTTIIAGYAQNGYHSRALTSFRQAQINRIESDSMLLASVLQVCSELKLNSVVKEIHARIIRKGLRNLVLENTLVNTYGKCGCVDYAVHVYELIKVKNVVSWTTMMSCLVQNGLANEALEVFASMKETKIEPDSVSLLSLLSATAGLSSLRKGKEIHGYLIRKQFALHGPISSSLVDMYASCGSIKNSYNVFSSIAVKDLVLWTSMVNAYGMHGMGKEAVRLFNQMIVEKIRLDHISFLAILYACSHSLLIDEGKAFFKSLVHDYGLNPWPEHYTCMVDLLGRANRLDDAILFVEKMETNPNAAIWRSLLGACKVHSNVKLGNLAAEKLLELDPYDIKNYVLVSNFYALCGQWDDLEYIRKKMRQKGLKKDPGCSWIEIGNKIHVFTVRDKSHPDSNEIYIKLDEINDVLKRVGGYMENDKAEMLNGHSERLAIAYGLLKTQGMPIYITKNLRVCDDCHTFSKLVSKYYDREIIVRDANRFHHFGFGVCSCKDFW
ncbi:putative tetratricopeptide-like helical domain superfamily, DYW domain-containing protein [Helianthus annuus]|uniref:Putative pentatricopeptide repeat-containing protein n=1 Tax=Helianthus annuus TaxID=4232 RepID=A0A251UJI1_HELAN|nr:pentatricopeptide repeat-containing protein At3g63370, chloroplastic [Helianthus annuus]KAF5782411.1 putative tetratricopeptide-like helical domain superfamily, DYW domain-containing protein [Helianthus annuus]KAJ0509829.1 putative tetratricopeptide-like helical domain superfamily, DYW domain-containing protein [Helianthus annuus]KAJ0871088.1 putative tetratricopeptide-like helical domain superfamily, DYW domain-containing protein [Helianthus annuus]KAJ0875535.1 putative tetratricopeptide-li